MQGGNPGFEVAKTMRATLTREGTHCECAVIDASVCGGVEAGETKTERQHKGMHFVWGDRCIHNDNSNCMNSFCSDWLLCQTLCM